MRAREILLFLVAGLVLCGFMLGDALIGRSLPAPLDIAAAHWPQYRFLDPNSDGIPTNHFVVDQLGYDLPLQWTIYHAVRRGEFPWWDPFTLCGRPLAADAHISAADPVRIACYLVSPSLELAYTWTRVAHFLIGGLGMFCLLRRLGVSFPVAGCAGLLAMVAGSSVIFFSHPWIWASFIYYPWVWVVWHRLWEDPRCVSRFVAPTLAAAALCAGNLQSHTYLPLFAFAFCVGYAGRSGADWRRALSIVVPTGVLAALLAAPILWPEIELFRLNSRPIDAAAPKYEFFDGLLILSGLWPWATGTFRSLTRMILGFHFFIGTAGFLLAVLGLRSSSDIWTRPRRTAFASLLVFFGIMTIPPLASLLYPRLAGLATMGGVVLAAFGAETLRSSMATWRRSAWLSAGLAVLIALGTAVVVKFVYPKLKPRALAMMEAHAADDGSDGRSLPLRRFQVENYPREIGFTNPEVITAWLGLVALVAVFAVPRWRRLGLPVLLVLNLVSPLLFARRFIPRAPIEQWQRLLNGSPPQREARALLRPRHLRLDDAATSSFTGLFPQEMAHLHGVHVGHGYSALVPPNAAWLGGARADFRFADGRFEPLNPDGSARFSWIGEPRRGVSIVEESLNSITLEIGDGPAGWLLRTDTRYPGWRANNVVGEPLAMEGEGRTFTKIEVPAGPARIRLTYRPSGHKAALMVCGIGLLGSVAWAGALARKRRLCGEPRPI